MLGVCCEEETETSAPVEPSTMSGRRRRMEIHQFKFLGADMEENGRKRQKLEIFVQEKQPCKNEIEERVVNKGKMFEQGDSETKSVNRGESSTSSVKIEPVVKDCPNFGMTSVCGRRRDMEDAVAIHPLFTRRSIQTPEDLHFFGVYDGHGCSHVAMKCKDRMHEIVKDELEIGDQEDVWKQMMERSFSRMDKEVTEWSSGGAVGDSSSKCRCKLQTPQCDTAGSTAVVAVVTPNKIVVSNCGDSRAVLCRNGVAVPLSSDHKPDRPEELNRIQTAGGRVIYWDGARVLGVLAMSRAIGDNYLKPFVIPEPEVTVTDRMAEDDCLILASDGLWDVVSNETACSVARMCLQARKPASPPQSMGSEVNPAAVVGESSDMACTDASILLTKLALARHSTDNVSVIVVDLRRGL